MTVLSIELKHISKRFGPLTALDNLSLTVAKGSIVGVLGPNGAGKTTCLRICSSMLRPDNGQVLFDGREIGEHLKSIRRLIALMPQGRCLDPMLNVVDNLNFHCRLIGMSRSEMRQSIDAVTEVFGLGEFLRKSIFAISGGQFRRAQLARTFLGRPRYVLLDEPTLGIDIQGKLSIWKSMRQLTSERGCTVLLASNDMTEVEKTCDRVAFISHGKLLHFGAPDNLSDQTYTTLECRLGQPFDQCPIPPPVNVSVSVEAPYKLSLRFREYDDTVFRYLQYLTREYGIGSLSEERTSLADLFERYEGDSR
jgi:ABC-type multidrug transport system ATPase subunit